MGEISGIEALAIFRRQTQWAAASIGAPFPVQQAGAGSQAFLSKFALGEFERIRRRSCRVVVGRVGRPDPARSGACHFG